MNLYGGPIEQNFGEDYIKRGRRDDLDSVSSTAAKNHGKKPDKGEFTLSDDQIQELREKYNLIFMTSEEEEALLQDLIFMGILTKEDCGCYTRTGGNLFESLTKQVGADIKRLYQMAIAGRYGDSHIDRIRRQQKILDIIEQLNG